MSAHTNTSLGPESRLPRRPWSPNVMILSVNGSWLGSGEVVSPSHLHLPSPLQMALASTHPDVP
jgi:hypothetical protein